jgi:hypothetical protein
MGNGADAGLLPASFVRKERSPGFGESGCTGLGMMRTNSGELCAADWLRQLAVLRTG